MTVFNLTINELAKSLNVSRSTILRYIEKGIFKNGKHYIDLRSNANGRNAMRRFNVEACQSCFAIPPEKRKI